MAVCDRCTYMPDSQRQLYNKDKQIFGVVWQSRTRCVCNAYAVTQQQQLGATAAAPLGAIAAATVTVVATLAAAAAAAAKWCQDTSRGIPDGEHSDDQLVYSMVQLAVELEGDAASGGAGSVGSDVLAFKAHEAPQQVLQHCIAGDAFVGR